MSWHHDKLPQRIDTIHPLPPLTSPSKEDAKVNHNGINAGPKPHTRPCQSQTRRDVLTVQYCQPPPPTRMGLGAELSLKNDKSNEMVTIWSERLIRKKFRLFSRDTRVSGLTATPPPFSKKKKTYGDRSSAIFSKRRLKLNGYHVIR